MGSTTVPGLDPAMGEDDGVDEPEPLAALFLERWDPMVRRAVLIVGSVATAEEVVQDAFTEVHRRWATIVDPAAYLARVVTTGAMRRSRLQRRERPWRPADDVATVDGEPDRFHELLAGLSPRARAIVTLKFHDGLSEREIAEQVGCRPGTVGPTLTRALRRLAEEVEQP